MATDERKTTDGHPGWAYRALFALAAPLLAGHSAWQALRERRARVARQKLGLGLPRRDDRPLWVHMSSVGEVNAASTLVAELRRRHPGLPIVASTFTATGGRTARERFGPDVEHVYLPLDLACAVGAFLDRVAPRCALIVETEIWPELFYQCRRRGIPLLIVNGRLSERTLQRAEWIRRRYGRTLTNVERVLARSEADARHFAALGMPADRIAVVGNIKFAAPDRAPRPIALPRRYVVAASTHEDEELQLGRAWLASGLAADRLLVIVPRHPARKSSILAQLRPLGLRMAVRSDGEAVTADTQLYLADTLGELQDFIAGAELVCMGGSLIPRGGQNPIEPARLGKAVLFGPHMHNFAEERELLLRHEGAIEARDAADMAAVAAELLSEPQRLERLGRQARQAIGDRADVAARYADALAPYLSR